LRRIRAALIMCGLLAVGVPGLAVADPPHCAATLACAPAGPRQYCQLTAFPRAYPMGGILQVNIIGRGLSCRGATQLLQAADLQLSKPRRWGRVRGWECQWWTRTVVCTRGRTTAFTTDPGD
jgi:hypothetical protein